jgi:hypothetical protein
MVPSALLEHVPRQVLGVKALHDDHLGGGLGIIAPRAPYLVVPVQHPPAHHVTGVGQVVWVIQNQTVAALAGGAAACAQRDAMSAMAGLHSAPVVHVLAQLVVAGPVGVKFVLRRRILRESLDVGPLLGYECATSFGQN